MVAENSQAPGTDTASEFSITRVVNAPRELVWRTWTETEHLARWWGPKGFTMVSCTVDLRPGGLFHYGMRGPNDLEMWGKFVYREIVPPEKLVYVLSFSDKDRNTRRHIAGPGWPLEILSTVTMTEHEGRTTLELKAVPLNATEEECRTFMAGFNSMRQGFGGTFDQLDAYLARL